VTALDELRKIPLFEDLPIDALPGVAGGDLSVEVAA
jgi:hypothetical protein